MIRSECRLCGVQRPLTKAMLKRPWSDEPPIEVWACTPCAVVAWRTVLTDDEVVVYPQLPAATIAQGFLQARSRGLSE